MGGCFMIVLLPVLIGVGVVSALIFFMLPIYAVFAVVMALFAAIAYFLLRRNNMFTRYEDDKTWRKPAAIATKWILRFGIAFFAVTGLLSMAGWALFFQSHA